MGSAISSEFVAQAISESIEYDSSMPEKTKKRAPRNRTLTLSLKDRKALKRQLLKIKGSVQPRALSNRTICGDLFKILDHLPRGFVDLLFLDPPYNLNKRYHSSRFERKNDEKYEAWMESWFARIIRTVKPGGSVYICSDWRTSPIVYRVASRSLTARNRITWEREKGRGAQNNWKNNSEDIWFFTRGDKYKFDINRVKLLRRVKAPYRDSEGDPKDWKPGKNGNVRLTYPGNLWNDITVPYWSMPENTDHPTQKPEKLLAKIILSSTDPENFVFDPFLGSGTTSVVAKKLGRNYLGIEIEEEFALFAEKRLSQASINGRIQGYEDGVFLERNFHFRQR